MFYIYYCNKKINDFSYDIKIDTKEKNNLIQKFSLEEKGNFKEYWENNVLGSINLFQAMKEYKCKTIVFSSSATVYKTNEEKIKEDQRE